MKSDPTGEWKATTITKDQLIDLIKDLDPDDKICISFDGCAWGITGLECMGRDDGEYYDISEKDKCDICLGINH